MASRPGRKKVCSNCSSCCSISFQSEQLRSSRSCSSCCKTKGYDEYFPEDSLALSTKITLSSLSQTSNIFAKTSDGNYSTTNVKNSYSQKSFWLIKQFLVFIIVITNIILTNTTFTSSFYYFSLFIFFLFYFYFHSKLFYSHFFTYAAKLLHSLSIYSFYQNLFQRSQTTSAYLLQNVVYSQRCCQSWQNRHKNGQSTHISSSVSNLLKVQKSVILLPLLLSCCFPNATFGQHAKQVATIPGQLVIGCLLSIREQPSMQTASTRTCGEVREQYGIHRVEAAFQTIDAINRNPDILPNITLGIEIRDSCWYSAIALEQSIEFIRDAMAASEEKAFAAASTPGGSGGSVFGDSDYHDHGLEGLGSSSGTGHSSEPPGGRILGLFPASPFGGPRFNLSTPCPKAVKKAKNIVGVVGPASSTNSIQVQNLLQLFNIPQIGYSATSKDLSDKNFFKFFLRVVPSDFHQAQVMTSLFAHYNWTYVSVIYTDGSYGSGLMEIFKSNAQEMGICIAHMESIPANGENAVFEGVVHSLMKYPNARVVACFCEGSSVKELLRAKKRLNLTTEFLLVGSDGWSDRPDVVKGVEKEAQGSLTVRIYSPFVRDFDDYYFGLTPANNRRNPWFNEFWERQMNCSLRNATGQIINHPNNVTFTKPCTGEERLSDFVSKRRPRYKQDNKMSFVIKAIWTMAHGLHSMQREICGDRVAGLCSDMLPVNGSILLQHLNRVRFNWDGDLVEFDKHGDPPGRYDIMNFQELKKGEFEYVQVGEWISSDQHTSRRAEFPNFSVGGGPTKERDRKVQESLTGFRIFKAVQWPRKPDLVIASNYTGAFKVPNKHTPIPVSVCSQPCPKGTAKNIQSDSVKCCWICVPCRENEYLTKEEKCKPCKIGTWPNEDLTGCKPIPVEFIRWTDTASLVSISTSLLGFTMTLFTMIVFIRHNNTPIVKSSTRELSYMILFGMFLCHSTTFALIAKPSKITCYITRILPGLSFAIMYAALVTKTNRIARILAGSKKRIITKKPRFMSATAQVVITWLLISVEVGIIVTVLIKEPVDKMFKYPSLNRVMLTCNTKVLGISAPLGFDFVLIGFCTLYAIKTRNVPENFNEAKFIGFTMYTTLVIWIAFVPIYYNSDENVISLSLCISFSAIVALFLLFFPKLYIMLFKPEKNNRSYFTTAKNVRCHIGYMAAQLPSSSTTTMGGGKGDFAYGGGSTSISGGAGVPASSSMGVSRHSSHSTSDFSIESPSGTHYRKLDIAALNANNQQGNVSTISGGQNNNSKGKVLIGKDLKLNKGGGRGGFGRGGSKGGFFSRLRISKQDKIAANVQEHIRAVRAAEALDRQTGRNRRFHLASQSFSERADEPSESGIMSSSGGKGNFTSTESRPSTTGGSGPNFTSGRTEDSIALLSRQDSAARRVRIIHLLRRTFGDELERLPQFAAIVSCLKNETVQYAECATQTNGIGNGNGNNGLQNGGGPLGGSSSGGIVEVYRNVYQTSGSVRHRTGAAGGVSLSSSTFSGELPLSHNNGRPRDQLQQKHRNQVSKALSSDESVLSVASGSVVVEENVSSESGGEDGHSNGGQSESSGVYKNIIINLGNLMQPEHQMISGGELGGFYSSPPPPPIPPLPESVVLLANSSVEGGNVSESQSRRGLTNTIGASRSLTGTTAGNSTSADGSGSFHNEQPLVGILKKSK